MCGIFGFIAREGQTCDLGLLRKLAIETEARGPHAFGFAWIDAAGRVRSFKSPGRISKSLRMLSHLQDARAVIGHCRYVTNGAPHHNINNHPHPADGGWIVHNGTIRNHRFLVSSYGLMPSSECDSEVAGLLIEEFNGSIRDRVRRVVNLSDGPMVLCGLWARPARLIIARRGKPLHFGVDDRACYFASLAGVLPRPKRCLDNTVRTLTQRDGHFYQNVQEVEPCLENHVPEFERTPSRKFSHRQGRRERT